MTTDDWIKLVPGILGSCVGIAGIYFALKNLDRWRTEMLAKHEFDVARSVLAKALHLELEMRDARFDFRGNGADLAIQKITEASKALEASLIDARVLWGAATIEKPSQMMLGQSYTLRNALWVVQQYTPYPPDKALSAAENQRLIQCQEIVMGFNNGDEKFERYVAEAIKMFEESLRKYFAKPVGWSDSFMKLLSQIQMLKDGKDSAEDT